MNFGSTTDRRRGFTLLEVLIALAITSAFLSAATITVNSTADTAANDGLCTLCEAITASNTNMASGMTMGECAAGDANPSVDTIQFAITTGCSGITNVCTITPASSSSTRSRER